MSKFLIFTAVLLLLTGCNDKKEQQESIKEVGTITITPNALKTVDDDIIATYDMDGNKKITLSLSGEESTLTRQLGAIVSVRNSYSTVQKELLSKRLSKNYFLKCSACHDDYANGVIGPSLLTKSSDEIFDMIKSYKTNVQNNVLMQYLVSQMEDSEIRSLADEIASFNKEARESKDAKN
jgi:cytochrome c553